MSRRRNEPGWLERPLTARSAVLSLLLGRRPARARVGLLVRWCGLFGVSENAARVALSRMVERGELVATDGVYELAGRVRRRQTEQEQALDPPSAPWSGRWHVAVVSTVGRGADDRAALRDVLRRSRMAELREGVWVRPDNLDFPDDPLVHAHTWRWTGTPDVPDPRPLADRLFAMTTMSERGSMLLAALTPLAGGIADATLAPAFEVGAAALQHLRRDPLLPPELLPDGWPGPALRAAYLAYEASFSDAVARWYRGA